MIILIEDKFHKEIDKYQKKKTHLKGSLDLVVSLRLIFFISIIYLGYRYVKSAYGDFLFFLSLLSIMIFIGLILYHNKLKDKLHFVEALLKINNRYLHRINGDWINFSDFGEDFIHKDHRYSGDLDITGPSSLFQRINLSSTWIGRQALARDLLDPNYNKEEILNRQDAIKELSSKLDFIQNLEYESSQKSKMKNPEDLISYFTDKGASTYSNQEKTIIELLPIPIFLISGIILSFKIRSLYILVPALFIFQTSIWILGNKKNQEILNPVGSFKDNLEVYVKLLRVIEREDFQSFQLGNLKSQIFSATAAIRSIEKLDIISQMINIKHSGVLYLILNIFFLWDYRAVFALEKWKNNHGHHVPLWINSIGEFEALSSLSVLNLVEENISFPIIEDGLNIQAKSCGHPLLEAGERINNHIDIRDNILIITGSNMSGKTTFLRTIGINLVLLNAGAITISREFKSPIMNIYTSMRIKDDLKNKISTFYAELLRIKKILDYGKDNPNTIFLIDEIFTGTNSKDRVLGARNVLKNLNNLGLIGSITTHDFQLCELDLYPRIKNYHFAEDYIDGKISFDYKIKEGRSQSTNARYLMELVGIKIID